MTTETATNVSVDIGNNLTGLIERLAQQLGVAADKIFPWYVQQQVLEGWLFFAIILPILVLLAGAVVFSAKRADFKNGNDFAGLTAIFGFLWVAVFLIFLVEVRTATTQILNPEYHAMKAITQDLGHLSGRN